MKKTCILSIIGLAALASSCTTTGDPTTGGIFWSPAKAQARQQALMGENQALQSQLSAETAKTESLVAQRERLRAQIAAKKAELERAATPTQAATISHEIADLESQLAKL